MLIISSNKNPMVQKGFSLIEILIAIAISSVICIAAMSSIPTLFKHVYLAYFQYQLDRDVRLVLLNMEKDFRRIGYCSSLRCQGEPIKISAKFLTRMDNSCIIFAYDQDLSGQWVNANSKKIDSDFFGYRLNSHRLESNRNVMDCNGTRWQSLFDANLIKVNQLTFNWQPSKSLLEIILTIETKLLPNKVFNYQSSVFLRNL